MAVTNGDVDDYDEEPAKFAHLKVQPVTNSKRDFEILPQSQFDSRNLNQALTDFSSKDWSKCRKIMKGDMTCYYCKDTKGATQEECMFVSSTNPKNIKLERHEAKQYNIDSRRPSPTTKSYVTANAPAIVVVPENKEKFARLRMARPLMPTRATLLKASAEPLVTPKTSINPNDHGDSYTKKTIKRTVSHNNKNKFNRFDDFYPAESRVVAFESHVLHDDDKY